MLIVYVCLLLVNDVIQVISIHRSTVCRLCNNSPKFSPEFSPESSFCTHPVCGLSKWSHSTLGNCAQQSTVMFTLIEATQTIRLTTTLFRLQ